MSTIRDVQVIITRETQQITQAGFGRPLILATSTDKPYTLYRTLDAVAEDYGENTEAYRMANRIFAQTPRPVDIAILGVTYDAATGDPTTLTAALNDNEGDFYFLLCEEQGIEEITALSTWIEAQKKLYFVSTDDPTLQDQFEGYRTIPMYHKDPLSYPAEGWVGRCAPTDPGSITWKFKTINGVVASGASETEISTIKEGGGNTYIEQGGVLMTYDGRTTSGEWIDVMRSIDFLEMRIQESVFGILVRNEKIPFTNNGIAQIITGVESPLKQGYLQGMIADDADGVPLYSVSAPTRSEVSANDRANRILPDVNFTAEIAGAVHETRINGVVQV
ncbi:DUF3383 domain-containing protein [Gracilibacillus oryzae]|uniref:DUF3383 domain-containing protein n=1 Tax=Gracilibacillus oryzae TaxID=1672701 RepID=A0A7C8GWT2_9BACI|nr:DUF3383 family protein [Gracilibacillus oryzae]KAB8139266.1 DUF3383 domain-containing protein [Gracilibacillus oryzae]